MDVLVNISHIMLPRVVTYSSDPGGLTSIARAFQAITMIELIFFDTGRLGHFPFRYTRHISGEATHTISLLKP